MAELTDQQVDFPIIDSHIHLYAQDHIKDLAWTAELSSDHVLNRQNSIDEYRKATRSQPTVVGFVFVETDRKSSLSENGWTHPLEEIEFLERIKSGRPKEGEGHDTQDISLLLGAVPWAPMPANGALLSTYLEKTVRVTEHSSPNLIRGFRYLLQDKPPGTQLSEHFISSLLHLEKQGYKSFDIGIDFHRNGLQQLEETIQMLRLFYASSTNTLNIVLNHLCKPKISLQSPETSETFETWASCILQFATFPTTYMKLSGLFSEMPLQDPREEPRFTEETLELVRPYIRTTFKCFGPRRIMFGSDWPVCNVGGPGPEDAWRSWVQIVATLLDEMGCSVDEKASVWAGTANRAYGLGLELSAA